MQALHRDEFLRTLRVSNSCSNHGVIHQSDRHDAPALSKTSKRITIDYSGGGLSPTITVTDYGDSAITVTVHFAITVTAITVTVHFENFGDTTNFGNFGGNFGDTIRNRRCASAADNFRCPTGGWMCKPFHMLNLHPRPIAVQLRRPDADTCARLEGDKVSEACPEPVEGLATPRFDLVNGASSRDFSERKGMKWSSSATVTNCSPKRCNGSKFDVQGGFHDASYRAWPNRFAGALVAGLRSAIGAAAVA